MVSSTFCFLFTPPLPSPPPRGGRGQKTERAGFGRDKDDSVVPVSFVRERIDVPAGGLARRSTTGRADRVGPLTPPHKEKDNGEGFRLSY